MNALKIWRRETILAPLVRELNWTNNLLVLGTITALLSGCATYNSPEPLTITFERVKGTPHFSMDGTIWQPLTKKTVLKAGAIMRTDAGNFVELAFDNKPERRGPLTSHDEVVPAGDNPLKSSNVNT